MDEFIASETEESSMSLTSEDEKPKRSESPFILLQVCLLSCWHTPFPQTACRKKKRGKGKGESSDKSDSDDVEVIKEWNTSSRGGNPEGRNRAEPVEEGMLGTIGRVLGVRALHCCCGERVRTYKGDEPQQRTCWT